MPACFGPTLVSYKDVVIFAGGDRSMTALAAKDGKKLWKAAIKEFNLCGDHYFLENEQYQILVKKFNITGIPHYVLVDNNGEIVSPDAKRPSVFNAESINEELLADINTLLAK